MATINIAGFTPVDDPSYRYKMPRILCKVEGRGNGIKTVLVNVTDLGLALNREAPEITKFFGCEIGSQTSYAEDRAIVNGSHTAPALQTHLSKYIEKFVLCAQCKLPETHYKIKAGIIAQKCLACGHKENVDMTHKLTTFILGQHKKAKETAAASEKKCDKKDKKKDKKDKSSCGDVAADGENSPSTADNAAATTSESTKEKKPKKEKKDKSKSSSSSSALSTMAAAGGDGDSDDNEFTTVSPRLSDLKNNGEKEEGRGSGNGSGNTSGDTEEEEVELEGDSSTVEESIVRFRNWLTAANVTRSKEEVLEELRIIQTFQSLHPRYRSTIFIGAIFGGSNTANGNGNGIADTSSASTPTATLSPKEIASTIRQYKEYFLAIAGTNPMTQRHIIASFEWFFGTAAKQNPSNMKLFPIVLKLLFDEEIIEEEEVFLTWYKDLTRNEFSCDDSMISLEMLEELRENAAPFITWLQEAEEEDDDEEGEGEEEGDNEEEDD